MKTFKEYLNEVVELPIRKKEKFGLDTSRIQKKPHEDEKVIGKLGKDHEILHANVGKIHSFKVRNIETGKITAHVMTTSNKAGTHHVNLAASTGKGPKVHDLYHQLLTRGHVKTLEAGDQSPGGASIWRNLAKKRNITVHGWNPRTRTPENIDPQNPEETHVPYDEPNEGDKETERIARMPMVATKKIRKK
jgi:hypothetical protein